MLKRIVLLCLFLVCSSLPAFAHENNSLTIEPVGLYWGMDNVEFEHLFARHEALAFRANFSDYYAPGWSAYGAGAGMSYRFFPFTLMRAPRGLWLGPAADVVVTQASHGDVAATGVLAGAGAEIGYKWLFGGRHVAFVVSPFAKAQYWFGNFAVDNTPLPIFHGADIYLGLSLGIAF
jgi:hypothetical protein